MKASELIEKLTEVIRNNGDLEISIDIPRPARLGEPQYIADVYMLEDEDGEQTCQLEIGRD